MRSSVQNGRNSANREPKKSARRPNKNIRFRKGEIKIESEEYKGEYIVKVACLPNSTRLLSLEDIVEDPDFIKKHKSSIVSVEEYFSDIVDELEVIRETRQEKIDTMPKKVKDFYDNYYTIKDGFRDSVEAEKAKIGSIFKETVEAIVQKFVEAGDSLKEKLDKQLTRFEANCDHLRTRILENYHLDDVPSESEVLKNINEKKEEELDKYVQDLNTMIEPKEQTAYESMYDLLYHQIHENLKNPPKYAVEERTKAKLKKVEEIVQELLDHIVQDIKATSKSTRVVDMSKLTLAEARRGISQDGLCGFMEFQQNSHKVSFKLNKKILTQHQASITCIQNIGNRFIATGSRSGDVLVYQIATSQMIAKLDQHSDVVTCLCTLNPIYDLDGMKLCSGSANLDGRILIWDFMNPARRAVELRGHQGNITSICSLGDKRSLASAAHDGNIVIWDAENGAESSRQLAHSSMITTLRYLPSKDCLISGGWDANIKMWALQREVDDIGDHVKSVHLEKVILVDDPVINILARQIKGNYIVTVSTNNRLKVWNLESEEMEGEFNSEENSAEVCLLENKFKYGKADFITLNTSVKEDVHHHNQRHGPGTVFGRGSHSAMDPRFRGSFRADGYGGRQELEGYEGTSFFTQPRVQLVQNNKQQLKLVKVINHADRTHSLNVYDII